MGIGTWRRWIRAFALSWGVLQFALPLMILLGDAQSALKGSRAVLVHVEASDANACQPVHADECALCRFLSHNNAPTPRQTMPAVVSSSGTSLSQAPRESSCGVSRRLPDSRGPPIA